MTEAYEFGYDTSPASGVAPEDLSKPRLEVIQGVSEDLRHMFTLLADGNSQVVDYRGCEMRGGRPLAYKDPRYLARPILKVVE